MTSEIFKTKQIPRSAEQFEHHFMSPFPLGECANRLTDLAGTPTGDADAQPTCYQVALLELDSHTVRFYVYWSEKPRSDFERLSHAEGILHRQADGTTVVYFSVEVHRVRVTFSLSPNVMLGLAATLVMLLGLTGMGLVSLSDALILGLGLVVLVVFFQATWNLDPRYDDRVRRSFTRIVEETLTGVVNPYPFSWLYKKP